VAALGRSGGLALGFIPPQHDSSLTELHRRAAWARGVSVLLSTVAMESIGAKHGQWIVWSAASVSNGRERSEEAPQRGPGLQFPSILPVDQTPGGPAAHLQKQSKVTSVSICVLYFGHAERQRYRLSRHKENPFYHRILWITLA
jgi:hypothetical protein